VVLPVLIFAVVVFAAADSAEVFVSESVEEPIVEPLGQMAAEGRVGSTERWVLN
jgi:hypothetical protein